MPAVLCRFRPVSAFCRFDDSAYKFTNRCFQALESRTWEKDTIFTLTRYTFLTPSSAYSSYNHHPIAPHHGQTTVPGYILNMLRPTFDPPQTTLGCPPSYIPQCATHPAMHLEHIPLLPLLFGSLSSRSAVAHVQFAFHKKSRNKGA